MSDSHERQHEREYVEIRRDGGFLRGCLMLIGALAAVALIAVAGIWGVNRYIDHKLSPDPVTIARASLDGLREQNKLSAFTARYVAVVTSKQSRLGLTAEKTLIMPGTVQYQVDLGKLTQRDVAWDAGTRTLSVRLPPIEIMGPQVDMNAIKQYGSGGILMSLTDAEAQLDTANRNAGQEELIKQAKSPVPMKMARDATRRAVERSFAMPLRAAGIDATVKATFPGEQSATDNEHWDVSKSIEEVLANRH